MIEVYIGIGSNVGDRENNIFLSLEMMKKSGKIHIISLSSLYETEPEGYENQNWFLNCAAGLKTALKPYELLDFLKSIEQAIGRKKSVRWGPREIDLDLLLYDDLYLKSDNLIIPHPRMHERKFVLVPLAEIAADVIHPILNKSIKVLLDELDTQKIVRGV